MMGYGLDGLGSAPRKGKIFFFSTASRPALGPTWSPIQWVPGLSFPQDMKMTSHLIIMLRSRRAELYLHHTIDLHGIMLN
jgi:hypothetical protein